MLRALLFSFAVKRIIWDIIVFSITYKYLHIFIIPEVQNRKHRKMVFLSGRGVDPPPLIGDMSPKMSSFFLRPPLSFAEIFITGLPPPRHPYRDTENGQKDSSFKLCHLKWSFWCEWIVQRNTIMDPLLGFRCSFICKICFWSTNFLSLYFLWALKWIMLHNNGKYNMGN